MLKAAPVVLMRWRGSVVAVVRTSIREHCIFFEAAAAAKVAKFFVSLLPPSQLFFTRSIFWPPEVSEHELYFLGGEEEEGKEYELVLDLAPRMYNFGQSFFGMKLALARKIEEEKQTFPRLEFEKRTTTKL